MNNKSENKKISDKDLKKLAGIFREQNVSLRKLIDEIDLADKSKSRRKIDKNRNSN